MKEHPVLAEKVGLTIAVTLSYQYNTRLKTKGQLQEIKFS